MSPSASLSPSSSPSPSEAEQEPFFRIQHQATVSGGTTYAIEYGAGLASSGNLTVESDDMGPEGSGNIWQWTHQTVGGYNGRNYMRYTRWEDVNGDPDAGFFFNANTAFPDWESVAQDRALYLRFRVRWNNSLTLSPSNSSAQMKFFIFGGPGLVDGADRAIIFWERATDGTYGSGTDDNTQVTVRIGAGVGSDFTSATVPVGDWVHIQIGWRYTDAGTPFQRIWVNNNVEGSPTAERTSFSASWDVPEVWEVIRWGDIVSTNSFTGTDAQLDVMDMEMADYFDPEWSA